MTSLEEQILIYLQLNGNCQLPGLGKLSLEKHSARFDITTNKFLPPFEELILKETNTGNDEGLQNFLVERLGVDNILSQKMLNDYSTAKLAELEEGNSPELFKLGFLQKNENGSLSIGKTQQAQSHFKPVAVQQVVRENANHEIRVGENYSTKTEMQEYYEEELGPAKKTKKDRWILWSVLIALIACGLIATHLYLNDMNWWGNKDSLKIQPKETPKQYEIAK